MINVEIVLLFLSFFSATTLLLAVNWEGPEKDARLEPGLRFRVEALGGTAMENDDLLEAAMANEPR